MLSNLHRLLQIYADIAAVPVADLTGHATTPEISKSRNEAIWVVNQINPGPLADLGRLFGGRSVKAIDNALDIASLRIKADQAYAERLRRILTSMRESYMRPQPEHQSNRLDYLRAMAAGILSDPRLSDADACAGALNLLRERSAEIHERN